MGSGAEMCRDDPHGDLPMVRLTFFAIMRIHMELKGRLRVEREDHRNDSGDGKSA